ncbi:MAG: hypothetical protein M5R36_03870 [Deltaproteobacteria bacterium]|nr:hypothetical protein [Deltaproteobacteria bacterium]
MPRRLLILLLAVFVAVTAFIVACDTSKSDDDDDDDDDDDASDEDKIVILCDKLDACGFTDALDVDDCDAYGENLSEWLMGCAMRSESCRDLAECFNLPEGA